MGLALSFLSLMALAFVALYPKQEFLLVPDKPRIRGFKGDTLVANLKLGSGPVGSKAQLELTGIPKGVDSTLQGAGRNYLLSVRSPFAGLFDKFNVEIGVGDPMGIFARKEARQLDLAFEFLPSFLLAERRPVRVAPLVTGDRPAGKRGLGQEFYSAEASNSPHSSRDVLWKRQARSTTYELMVRVGESDLPESLTVGLAEPNNRAQRENPRWIDLASEAVACLGRPIVSAGSTLRVIHAVEDKVTISEAKDDGGLADLIIWLWRNDVPKEKSTVRIDMADVIMVPQSDTSTLTISTLLQRKLAVILSWSPRATSSGSRVAFFSGREDLSWLVARMAGR